jgi:hypothetical protein
MKTFILLFFSSITLMAEPAALEQARKSYESEISKIDEKYVTWLEKMIASAPISDKGAYRDELAKVSKNVREGINDQKDEAPEENWGKIIKIDSQDAKGYKIGRLKEGQTVKLQYISGIWRAYGGWKEESPDSATTSQHKLAFVLSSRTGDTTITNPSRTKDTPFEYQIVENGEYYLRMDDPAVDSNVGVVSYRISID